jgi:Xaa-Pro aminopeptidase
LEAVPDVLIYGDTIRSPELRHEVPLPIPDPFLYVERDGTRTVVISSLELARVRELEGVEVIPHEEVGEHELIEQGVPREEIPPRASLRACQKLGVRQAIAPPTFPLELADLLRGNGIEVTADRRFFAGRRRVKNAVELDGIRRAQRACEAAMDTVRDLLRRADASDSILTVDGEPLTSERLKRAIGDVFTEQDMASDEFIVSHGPQSAVGHEMGSGPISPGEPIVVDIWPRDRGTACYADMTRTYVVGDPPAELVEYHGLVLEALHRAIESVKPGIPGRDLFVQTCELFQEHGYPTGLTKEPGEVLEDGFFHGLGHGVGLEVHEEPNMGIAGHATLVAGDVVTVEPGLYRRGFGGCRLEDLVLVTDDGALKLTDYPYDLTP